MAVTVTKGDVVAFRLHAHHLDARLGQDDLLDAAGPCGVQDSPPGSALLALNARVRGLTRERVGEALSDDKILLRTWCMRGSPFLLPTRDAAVFTTGVLPPTEESMAHFLPGVIPALHMLDMSLTEAVRLSHNEIRGVLAGRQLAIDELGRDLAGQVAHRLTVSRRRIWQEEGPYAKGQSLGEAVVHFCVRILTLQGVVCFAGRAGNTAPFVLVDEWLGHPIPAVDPERARAELLRRYLSCYGPSGRADFAAWLGIRAGDTNPWWTPLEDELTPVEFNGPAWVLTADLDALLSAPKAGGVRLLPARDPYTQMRDHRTIVDEEHSGDVWRATGEPGTVLADGEITGTWRPRKRGSRLTITVTTFRTTPPPDQTLLREEAEQVALLRGASSVDLVSAADQSVRASPHAHAPHRSAATGGRPARGG